MANKTLKNRALKIEYNAGLNENGKMIIKSQTFSGIRSEATDDGLLTASMAIDALTKKDIHKTKEMITNEISEA